MVLGMAACGETQAENGACLVGGGWSLPPKDAAQTTSSVVISFDSGWRGRWSPFNVGLKAR